MKIPSKDTIQFCCVFLISILMMANLSLGTTENTILARLFIQTEEQWQKVQAMKLESVSEIISPEIMDVLITTSQMHEIESMSIRIEVLMSGQEFNRALKKSNANLDPEFHTYEEMTTELDSLAQVYPDIAKCDSIGHSTQKRRAIRAFKISDNVQVEEDEPAVLYDGVHHACEVMGLEICMYMINHLLKNYGTDLLVTYWVDNTEIWFVPLMNPDGHSAVTSGISLNWRKNGRDTNENSILYEYECNDWYTCRTEGVDINRNYDFNWATGGSGDPWGYLYRGPAPFSESENQALRNLAAEQRFIFSISYHSYGEIVFYPWNRGGGTPAPDDALISSVAAHIASLIPREYGGTYDYGKNGGMVGYSANWLYGILGTIDFMIEVNPSPIFIPSGSRIEEIAQRNMTGAVSLLDRIRGPGLTGHITEVETERPLSATIKILEIYAPEIQPRTSEPQYGRFYRMLLPGQYTVEVSRGGYVSQVHNVTVANNGLTTLDVTLSPDIHIAISNFTIDDDNAGNSHGNSDGVINYGEQIELTIELINTGTLSASGMTGILSSDDEHVTIIDSLSDFGDISEGDGVVAEDAFEFVVSTEIPHGHVITFHLSITDNLDRSWTDTCALQATAPELEYFSYTINDRSGDGDGLTDPGEHVELFVALRNSGGQEAETVSAVLNSNDLYVIIETQSTVYGNMPPDSLTTSVTPFEFSVVPECLVPYSIQFQLEIAGARNYARSRTFTIAVGEVAAGDVNLDGSINILDVILTVNAILRFVELNALQFSTADLNNDGVINVLDVVQIVNVILGSSPQFE
ncbi:MAG: hypothetical protein JSV84_05920 [Gemmatimonadota bacterium]|nr:MAG: hypothetical protein JSV84_05920 [Gemmatimonadota bacterium]